MKTWEKMLRILLVAGLILGCCACGKKNDGAGEKEVQYDLTKLNGVMISAQVSNMMNEPNKYLGKIVKMTGDCEVYTDETTGNTYYNCILGMDATACCPVYMEFLLEGEPDMSAYPKTGEPITVTGEFQTYLEGEYLYCHLINSTLS